MTIERLVGLSKAHENHTVYIEWRRGSKKKTGLTKRVLVSRLPHLTVRGNAVWDEQIKIASTFFKDKKGKFDSKKMSLKIKEDNGKKTAVVGKFPIDLGELINEHRGAAQSIPVKKDSKTMLKLSVDYEVTKIQDKKITK